MDVLQTLDEHKCSVTRLAWTQTGCQAKHLSDRLTLATADVSGKILVWNVNSGEVKARIQDNSASDKGGGVPGALTSGLNQQVSTISNSNALLLLYISQV